jgi:hypothetical protein
MIFVWIYNISLREYDSINQHNRGKRKMKLKFTVELDIEDNDTAAIGKAITAISEEFSKLNHELTPQSTRIEVENKIAYTLRSVIDLAATLADTAQIS